MRCEEVKNRIEQLNFTQRPEITDSEILRHLDHCSKCCEMLQTEQLMANVFKSASVDDDEDIMPLSEQFKKIDARLENKKPKKVISLKIAYGIAAMLALFFLSMLPFSNDSIVGYNLTLNGVAKEIALDNDLICDMLFEMGLIEAGVDVGDCSATCDLTIFDLKNEKEIQLVVTAISLMNPGAMNSSVVPIMKREYEQLHDGTI